MQALVTAVVARAVLSLPGPVVALLAGRPPAAARGLHPEALLLARLARLAPGRMDDRVPVAEQRRLLALSALPMAARPRLPVAVSDHEIPPAPGSAVPIGARLYVPGGAPAPGPLLVFFHGGGWVQGSVATHDGSCRLLAHLAGVRVLSVDYRLAPEHPYPAAVHDAVAAYAWAAREAGRLGADPARLAVGGDSAGGNLAAVLARAARDDDALPAAAFQLLIYPACDLAHKAPSVRDYADGWFLTEHGMDWYVGHYVPDPARRAEPDASPLLAGDLRGLPPAYVATCLTDPLRDEGEAYAAALRAAGVAVGAQRFGQLHGCFNTTVLRSSRDALATMAGALRQGLDAAR
ncbi:alpha/beta hydrolase [Baekduia soli]|uniref:Alpha/beta hydrolase n=1 Tax=Baekduia soli TaxID=496014 RepID=A0A5B8UD16_9ACTN|nr:alpha/beta hydrolase [Baekduia soli]